MEKEATFIKLTETLFSNLIPKDIIYAEITSGGGMGNTGGIMVYQIEENELICYETSIYTDEKMYANVEKLIFPHQSQFNTENEQKEEILFDFYYGGMGNNVFINKNMKLEIWDECFIYEKNNNEYVILPSVAGVFDSVVYNMKNPNGENQ